MQKYFAGELRPDQEKSWRAEDGIFVLTSKAALEIAARDKKIDLLITDKELDRQEIFTLSKRLAGLTAERDGYLNGQQQMQDTCSRLQDSIAKYAKERKVLKADLSYWKELAAERIACNLENVALKAERDLLKKHQAICECGGLSIDHNISDNHQVSDMISPCPFKEQIADLKAKVEKLREALKRIRDWPYDIMGDCVYDARKEAEDALEEAADG